MLNAGLLINALMIGNVEDMIMSNGMITLAYALATDDFNSDRLTELLEAVMTGDLESQMLAALPLTDDPSVRNIIALKISENGSPDGKKAFVLIVKQLLENSRTTRCRGTLLYALHEMHEPLPLSFLLNQIADADASYELQSEAFEMIQEGISSFSSRDIKDAFRIVEGVNLQQNECMHEVLEMLKEEVLERDQMRAA